MKLCLGLYRNTSQTPVRNLVRQISDKPLIFFILLHEKNSRDLSSRHQMRMWLSRAALVHSLYIYGEGQRIRNMSRMKRNSPNSTLLDLVLHVWIRPLVELDFQTVPQKKERESSNKFGFPDQQTQETFPSWYSFKREGVSKKYSMNQWITVWRKISVDAV